MENKIKATILFRGNDFTSNYYSATVVNLRKNMKHYYINDIIVDGINLDKRNPQKLIDKLEDLEIVYVGSDEEWIIDLITEKFEKIDIRYIDQKLMTSYILEELMSGYKNLFGNVKYFTIKNLIIEEIEINKFDYDQLSSHSKDNMFSSYDECQSKLLKLLSEDIEYSLKQIATLREKIKINKKIYNSHIKNIKSKGDKINEW